MSNKCTIQTALALLGEEIIDDFCGYDADICFTAASYIDELIEENKSLKVAIETNRIRLLQYENLRKCFSQLTNLVLGENYYNESYDVYRADEYTCRDIWDKAKPVFSKRKWRGV